MTINERIRYFRKDILCMNQTVFAESIGMKQRGASSMEQDGATVTERAIKSICSIYNVNEDWLRYGIEPIYIQPPTFSLDQFVQERGATDLELDILKAYFDLDPDLRKMLIEHFKKRVSVKDVQNNNFDGVPATPEELEQEFPPVEPDNKSEVG